MPNPEYTLNNQRYHPNPGIDDSGEREQDDWSDFFEFADVPLQVISAEGTILAANRAAFELLGLSRASYIGRNVTQFHADDRSATCRSPVVKEILEELIHGEAVHRRPARLRHRNGTIREVLISASPVMTKGKLTRSRCVIFDVTERRRHEENMCLLGDELQRTIDQLSPILRSLPRVGILVSQDDADVRLNANLAALSSPSSTELDTAKDSRGPVDSERCLDPPHAGAPAALDEKEVFQGDAAEHLLALDEVPLFDAEGKPRGNIKFVVAPIEQRRFERQLMKAERKREEHFAGLAMELRNALGAIRDANELIKARMPEDSVVRQSRKMIDRQVRQAARLLDRELPLLK